MLWSLIIIIFFFLGVIMGFLDLDLGKFMFRKLFEIIFLVGLVILLPKSRVLDFIVWHVLFGVYLGQSVAYSFLF